ncbi:MAG: hypothetical protein IPM39_26055 [Chloroflexi bacterium]|nr:hypothetical protein [Chloroflexota bacterium]
MKIYQLSLPNFSQIEPTEQAGIIGALTGLFAGPLGDYRQLTMVLPTRLDNLLRSRRRLAMSRSDERARRGLLEEVRLLEEIAQADFLKCRHYLIDYANVLSPADLTHWLVRAEPGYPQLPISGEYAETIDHMVPVLRDRGTGRLQVDNSRYRYGVIASYQLTRTWDWQRPLGDIITSASGPLIICVDARKVHPERVSGATNFWEGMRRSNENLDAEQAKQEAVQALLARSEAVHHVQVLFMVLDKKVDRLRERLRHLRNTQSAYFKLDSLHGYQAAAGAMFGPEARPTGLPHGHHNVLSSGAAVCAGMWGIGREQETNGIYVGISHDENSPHVSFLEWKGNDPFHAIILGLTGLGKTVFSQALAWRLVEQDVQAIFLEPQGHCRRLAALAGGENVSYHEISYDKARLNILDVVYENETEQYDHVITLLALLLDPVGHQPRRFDNAEVAAIRKALRQTYAHYDWQSELLVDRTLTPTLESFCRQLHIVAEEDWENGRRGDWENGRQGERETTSPSLLVSPSPSLPVSPSLVGGAASSLAQEIESLYVYGDYAPVFNGPSNLDLTLQERLVLFNFQHVPEQRRALFYYAVLAGINLQVRRHPRKRAIFVDEVHYMARESRLMGFLAHMVKTVRTYGAAVIMIDQNLEAFIGVEGARAESMQAGINVAAGQMILDNLAWSVTFPLPEKAAARFAQQYPGEILSSHVQFLARYSSNKEAGAGRAVVRYKGRAEKVQMVLRPMERQCLLGS